MRLRIMGIKDSKAADNAVRRHGAGNKKSAGRVKKQTHTAHTERFHQAPALGRGSLQATNLR